MIAFVLIFGTLGLLMWAQAHIMAQSHITQTRKQQLKNKI